MSCLILQAKCDTTTRLTGKWTCEQMKERGPYGRDKRKLYICRIRNPGRDISFPIFIRKEIETRKLERKSNQQISRLNDLLYRLIEVVKSIWNRMGINTRKPEWTMYQEMQKRNWNNKYVI